MESIQEALQPLIDLLPERLRPYWLAIYGGIALVILLPLAWYKRKFLKALVGIRPRPVKEAPKLDEVLAAYPPPPPPGSRRLLVEGIPARIRLVVVPPLGKGSFIKEEDIEELLNHLRYGLGSIARQDQAVFRVWPPQLSAHAFPAIFNRLVHSPDPEGRPSRWVLLAGPTPPRPRPLLLGMALLTDEPTTIGRMTMEPSQWVSLLQIHNLETPEKTEPANPPPPPAPAAQPPRPTDKAPPARKREGSSPDFTI
jgi:hypothetical protein